MIIQGIIAKSSVQLSNIGQTRNRESDKAEALSRRTRISKVTTQWLPPTVGLRQLIFHSGLYLYRCQIFPLITSLGPNPAPPGTPVPTGAGLVAGGHEFFLRLVARTFTARLPRCGFWARKKLPASGVLVEPVASRKDARSKPTRP